jgi:hypothetical protein
VATDAVESFSSNTEFYAFVDQVAERLRAEGLADSADRLHALLHRAAWSSSSELIGEVGKAIIVVRGRSDRSVSPDLVRDLERCLAAVRRVWPDIS